MSCGLQRTNWWNGRRGRGRSGLNSSRWIASESESTPSERRRGSKSEGCGRSDVGRTLDRPRRHPFPLPMNHLPHGLPSRHSAALCGLQHTTLPLICPPSLPTVAMAILTLMTHLDLPLRRASVDAFPPLTICSTDHPPFPPLSPSSLPLLLIDTAGTEPSLLYARGKSSCESAAHDENVLYVGRSPFSLVRISCMRTVQCSRLLPTLPTIASEKSEHGLYHRRVVRCATR